MMKGDKRSRNAQIARNDEKDEHTTVDRDDTCKNNMKDKNDKNLRSRK